MKKVILIVLAVTGLLSKPLMALPSMHGVYGELGLGPFPLPIPVFGVGLREQQGHHGFDISLKASTVVSCTHLKTSLLYHYYFKPCIVSQFYTGLGISSGVLFGRRPQPLLSPEFVFGKQYMTKTGGIRFFQAQASFPTFAWNTKKHSDGSSTLYMPLVVLSYGVIF